MSSSSSFADGFKRQYRRSPILFPIAVAGIAVGAFSLVVVAPFYYRYNIVEPYKRYPEQVAKKLRRAVFYSQPPYLDLNEAHRYYRLALAAAAEARMDPFGDPVIAIKLAAVAMFKRAGQYPLASEALRNICVDCHRWLDEFGDAHRHDGRRTRILRNFVTLSIDLADLYACKYVNEPENAEQSLVGAVDVALAETRRREREGDAEGEGEWFQPAEIGMMLEALGSKYEEKDFHYLATPLFVAAFNLCPPQSCHRVVLMNNIAASLAQQLAPPPELAPPSDAPSAFPATPVTRAQLVAQGRVWAQRAVELADSMPAAERTSECIAGGLMALINLGQLYAMEGNEAEARKRFHDAEKRCKDVNLDEGVAKAKACLELLDRSQREGEAANKT